jgi:hypothetical protein
MAKALVIEKNVPLSLFDIIRYQMHFYCFMNNIRIAPAQLDTLSYLGLWGEINISDFCQQVTDLELFTNPQTVRNFIIKCVKDGYIIRKGLGNKNIELSNVFSLLNSGTILINLKVYHADQIEKSNS